jgi:pimeloyl-ACP methyl ester carboxylesterase
MDHMKDFEKMAASSSYWAAASKWLTAAAAYQTDFLQRGILFADILRKRGNTYLEHIKQGQPPVLVFKYDWVLDGRELDRPVNYAIVRIRDRRKPDDRRSREWNEHDRRKASRDEGSRGGRRRPIVVIDPRAGHGPGIGGSKLSSQIGMALNQGHPVYFIMFFTDPVPGQTLSDVQAAEVRFLEEVARRHPDAEKPAVIGNCQAGWAAALIGADRPDVTGPLVFNGSPLSYWGGVEGANPMRYKGGLTGGVWMTSLWSDLGNGKFDGASLVAGFEDLNPANTLWTKQYNVWANVDTEEERYLNFEKWWGGFFKMNAEEIHFIVDSLFVGNELEQGYLKLQDGKAIHLKNFKDPIVVFASQGGRDQAERPGDCLGRP